MANSRSGWYWQLRLASCLAMGGAITSFGDCARTQITSDNTLGAENSVVTPNVNIKGLPSDQIDGGATRGANLFHSFREFNIDQGRGAYFTNPAGIENILSRVTGNVPSRILGTLGVLGGNANLFLINPNGIIFGPNARLDVGGSFVGSTASSLNFADGTQFSATAPQTTPLLTISVPIGLQYGGTAGGIQVQESSLQVRTGKTLALIGGDVSVEGGESGKLLAPGGHIELGGFTGAGIVDIEGQQSDGSFELTSLRFPDLVERADVSLTNLAYVSVAASGGGSIAINARNLEILGSVFGGSQLLAGIASGLGSPEAIAGDITLNATGAIALANSYIFNHVRTGAVGNGGAIEITAGSLALTEGAQVGTTILEASEALPAGRGNAGNVKIDVSDSVTLTGENNYDLPSGVFSNVKSGAVGNSGTIDIRAGALSLSDGAQVTASTSGIGDAGDLTVRASDSVELIGGAETGPSGLFTVILSGAEGDGGNLTIETGQLIVRDGARISASTRGIGDSGDLTVRASDSVELTGAAEGFPSLLSTQVNPGAEGDGGDLTVETGRFSVRDGARMSASTFSIGDAGDLTVRASDSVELVGTDADGDSSGLFASVEEGAEGVGGNLTIETERFSIQDGAVVSASTSGIGDAGNLTVRASDLVELVGTDAAGFSSGLFANKS